MDEEMQLYWETVRELVSNELLTEMEYNPIRKFEAELIEGPILDLGCGQSPYVIEYCKKGKEIYAVDNDEFQLSELKSRIKEISEDCKIHYITSTILDDDLPQNKYSLIIMNNILHFFSMKECPKLINDLMNKSLSGTLFLSISHSTKHHISKSNDYFKHFFSESDFDIIFPNNHFEKIYFADIVEMRSELETSVQKNWINKVLDKEGINDQLQRWQMIENHLSENVFQAKVCSVYKKR